MAAWKRTRDAQIPFDTQWEDYHYMNRYNDFTLKEGYAKLPDFINDLHKLGMHFVPIIVSFFMSFT